MTDGPKRVVHPSLPWISRFTRYLGPRLPPALRARLRGLLFELKTFHKTLPGGLSARIESLADWEVYNEVFGERIYDLAIDKTCEGHDPELPLRFADLGANVGYFTLHLVDTLRQHQGPAVATHGTLLDANPRMVEQLRRRLLQENHLAGLDIVHGLVGQREGVGTFQTTALHGRSALTTDGTGTSVAFVDLDRLFATEERVDLVKMDVEGAELTVLETYPDLFRRVQVATLELHADVCDTQRCKQLLHAAGLQHSHEVVLAPTQSVFTAWR